MQKLAPWLYALTLVTLTGLILPSVLKDGMFMDGQLYATVSKNLAEGYGTWWFPKFSETPFVGLDAFHEHPPLVFWIQALFFKALGPSIYTERIYSFTMALINALLIWGIWRQLPLEIENKNRWGWLPVLTWITMPIGYWAFTQNLQENTMGVFTTGAVLCYLVGQRKGSFWLWTIISGVLIFCASFCKGVPGFFPWAVPFIYWLVLRRTGFGKMVVETLLLVLVPVLIYTALVGLVPDAKENLSRYVFERLLVRVSENPTVNTRFMPIVWILVQLAPAIGLWLICWLSTGRVNLRRNLGADKKWFWFFLLTGLAGSLPIMLTMVQRHFYLTPSFQFFGITSALFILPWLQQLFSKAGPKFLSSLKGLVLLLTIVVAYASYNAVGKYGRDEEKLHDTYLMLEEIPFGSTISIDRSISEEWSTKIYMARHGRITWAHSLEHEYYMHAKGTEQPEGYVPMELGLIRFELMKRED